MGIVSGSPASVSLDDSDATRDELEALRNVLRSDEPYFDEPPMLEDVFYPTDSDEAWWLVESGHGEAELDYDRWLDSLADSPSLASSGDWRNGQFGYEREQP